MNLTKHAHKLIDEHFPSIGRHITFAVDATCGNGSDSLFLAQRAEKLLSFDIQKEAIERTQQLLSTEQSECQIEYILNSHEHLLKEVQHRNLQDTGNIVDVVMFNLGFLPKSDDLSITTTLSSTVLAVKQATACLSDHGVISILCYRGHKNGPEEFNAIKQFLESLDPMNWQVSEYLSAKPTETTPVLLFIKQQIT